MRTPDYDSAFPIPSNAGASAGVRSLGRLVIACVAAAFSHACGSVVHGGARADADGATTLCATLSGFCSDSTSSCAAWNASDPTALWCTRDSLGNRVPADPNVYEVFVYPSCGPYRLVETVSMPTVPSWPSTLYVYDATSGALVGVALQTSTDAGQGMLTSTWACIAGVPMMPQDAFAGCTSQPPPACGIPCTTCNAP